MTTKPCSPSEWSRCPRVECDAACALAEPEEFCAVEGSALRLEHGDVTREMIERATPEELLRGSSLSEAIRERIPSGANFTGFFVGAPRSAEELQSLYKSTLIVDDPHAATEIGPAEACALVLSEECEQPIDRVDVDKVLSLAEEIYLRGHGWTNSGHDEWHAPPWHKAHGKQTYGFGHAVNSTKMCRGYRRRS